MRVLVVEDEHDVREFLLRVLRDATWAPDGVATAAAAREQFAVVPYDLAVLDVGLPDTDGFTLCRELRAAGYRTPLLLLTARNAVNDRVDGLDAGADDYLAKPFAVAELLARLRALARRPVDTAAPVLRCADLTVDPARRLVHRGGQPLELTAREFALLEYLVRNVGRVCSRARILEHVWDDNFDPVANAVDVLVGRLRRKVDGAGAHPLVHTVRGAGYRLADESAPGS
jgi:DNA-binding response OmpR family regulator